MKLIDKDALVAEIERRLDELYNLLPNASKVENGMITMSEACNTGKYTALEYFKDYINTLEMKEVDLEKELIKWHKQHFKKDGTFIGKSGFYLTNNSQMDFAKHFFELGIQVSNKTRKGEEAVNSPEENPNIVYNDNTVYKDIVLIDSDGNRIKARIEQREKI